MAPILDSRSVSELLISISTSPSCLGWCKAQDVAARELVLVDYLNVGRPAIKMAKSQQRKR